MKKLLTLGVALLIPVMVLSQTSGKISGTVTDEDGNLLKFTNITVIGTNVGTATKEDGSYVLVFGEDFSDGQSVTVVAQYIGFKKAEATVTLSKEGTTQNFTLEADVLGAEEVVVTALGISKEKKALGYSVQDLKSDELNMVEQDNIVNALSGKIAGVQVLGMGGAQLGGSAKVRLRGANGMNDTQPLWVVDGTPIDNTSFSSAYSGRDYGNLANDINMDDIESLSVLKGAAASALYGTRAANGVILVTTKKGTPRKEGIGMTYSVTTSSEDLWILPEYQNEYGGGYTQDFLTTVDDEDGLEYNILNYAADESWGPKMDGTMYRPWWSWIHADFTGDGVDDYGTQIPMSSQNNNVKDFFNAGQSTTQSVSLDGGSDRLTYRLSIKSNEAKGVIPNSSLEKSNLGFNGTLNLTSKLASSINLNYANTKGFGRPASGYSPSQGNPLQSFNQWFQRQLDIDKLRDYRGADGSIYSWNMRSTTDMRPLYWDSPFFTIYENVAEDERNRLFGNFTTNYQYNENLSLDGSVRTDMYDFVIEDRLGSGGLETDFYSMEKISFNEMNYEARASYTQNFGGISFKGMLGGNLMKKTTTSSYNGTSGGLSLPGFYNLDASVDRPDVSTSKTEKAINSLFGQMALGYGGFYFMDLSLRNDISSTLPKDNNSYTYYSFSNSLVFSELVSLPYVSFGKVRASVAQVGSDTGPYNVDLTYSVGTPYGSSASLAVPDVLPNPYLKPAISSDTEFGFYLALLNNRLRIDASMYTSVKEDEIIDLSVPGSSGYTTSLVNAGKFTTTGTELQISGTPLIGKDYSVDVSMNYATSTSMVDELAEGLDARSLFRAYWGTYLYANVGEEWGIIQGTGYEKHANGQRIVNPETGNYVHENNMEFGSILPDYTGGFNIDIKYKNFDVGAAFDFQEGGQFYSLTRQWGLYSGMTTNTVGNNGLGNPVRDPVLDANGDAVDYVEYSAAGSGSGGMLVSGVLEDGTAVQYLTDAVAVCANSYYKRSEENLVDGSFMRFREFRIGYNVPTSLLEKSPLQLPFIGANIALSIRNVAMLSSAEKGIDPTTASNGHGSGFSYWEGGVLPSTRVVSLSLKVNF